MSFQQGEMVGLQGEVVGLPKASSTRKELVGLPDMRQKFGSSKNQMDVWLRIYPSLECLLNG